jgi:hypothetical protein
LRGKKEMEGGRQWLSFSLSREREQGGLAIATLHGEGKEGLGGTAPRGRRRSGDPAQRPAVVASQQRPGHTGHRRAGVAAQNRGGGTLTCGPHGTVLADRVKPRSNDFKINLN